MPVLEKTMPAASMSARRLRLVTVLVTAALFMEILDGSVIATALPSMARAFGSSVLALNVGMSAYLLALGVFIPLSGWMAGRYGARRIFIAAISLFTLASVGCASVHTLTQFVLLRVIQGIAGAMMVPVGRLVVMRFTPKERLMSTMQALIWPALVAPVFGPPVGGFIVTHANWRWIFYLNIPLGVLGLIAAWLLLSNLYEERSRRFDLSGFLLTGSGMFLLLWGLDRTVGSFDITAIALLTGGVLAMLLAVRHLCAAAHPMVSLRPYALPTFRAAMRGGAIARAAIFAEPFLLPLLFQVGFGYSAFRSGLLVLGVFVGDLAMKILTMRIMRRIGYRPILIGNGVVCMLALGACALIDAHSSLWKLELILVLSGMARSIQFGKVSTMAFSDVPREHMADANSLFNTVNQVGMAVGISVPAAAARAGHQLAVWLSWQTPGAGYRLAFPIISVLTLSSVIDAWRLPEGAGDHFMSAPRR